VHQAIGIAGRRAAWPSCPLAQLNLIFSTPPPFPERFPERRSKARNATGQTRASQNEMGTMTGGFKRRDRLNFTARESARAQHLVAFCLSNQDSDFRFHGDVISTK
jgi:hypothetical protein